MTNTTTKKSKNNKQYVDTNPVEALIHGVGGGVAQASADFGKGAVSDLWKQLLGGPEQHRQTHGDLQEGQELNLAAMQSGGQSQENAEKEKKSDLEPGIDYTREILHGEKRIAQENARGMENQIQQIVIELKRLASSSAVLEAEFKEITIEQRITNPGKYHVTFFEWMLTVVRAARMKVEDSGAWLNTFKSKKNQKQYWQMFKKHGTTFGLSNERVVATQTG